MIAKPNNESEKKIIKINRALCVCEREKKSVFPYQDEKNNNIERSIREMTHPRVLSTQSSD